MIKQLSIVLTTSYLTKIARDIILPSLPAIALYYADDSKLIYSNVGVYFAGIAVSRFFWANFAAKENLRALIMFMLFGFTLSSIACLVAYNSIIFLAARFFQAFFIAALPVLTRFLIYKIHGDTLTLKLYSYSSILAAWSPAVATGLGGFIQYHYGFKINLIVLIFISLLAMFIYFSSLPKKINLSEPPVKLLESYALLKKAVFWQISLPFALITAINAIYFTLSPYLLIKSGHLSPIFYGNLTFILIGASVLGRTLCGKLIDYISYQRIIIAASFLAFVSGFILVLLLLSSYLNLFLLITIITLSYFAIGLITPTAKVFTLKTFKDRSAIALSMLSVLEAVVSSFAALLCAYLPMNWASLNFSIFVIGCVSFGFAVKLVKLPEEDF